MVQWVYERAVASGIGSHVLVATPDQEIIDRCAEFGAEAVLTRSDHPSGTDRIAEVAAHWPAEVYVNVQGDEPLIDPATIAACARPLLSDPRITSVPSSASTRSAEIRVDLASVYAECPQDEIDNPAVVKVVTDLDGFALYFSRFPIPYPRNERPAVVKKHVGIYAYRRDSLLSFTGWKPGFLEQAESLEQLRFLEHGKRIFMSEGKGSELAVDTPEQAEEVRGILAAKGV